MRFFVVLVYVNGGIYREKKKAIHARVYLYVSQEDGSKSVDANAMYRKCVLRRE
jgi:hypothetical protein